MVQIGGHRPASDGDIEFTGGIYRVSWFSALASSGVAGKKKMECMQNKYEPTEVLHKGSDDADFHSPTSYGSDEMIDIMEVWKANYAIRDTHHHMQYHVEYPNTSYYADDNCNTVEYGHSVTGVIRTAVQKAGVTAFESRRVSRKFLTNLNIAQLQVIVNDLQRYIELLNDELVQLLMERDELQMSQDATLIDIEDLSLYF